MIYLRNTTLALGLVVAAAAASPALANSRAAHPGYDARAEAFGGGMNRAAALRACNAQANKFVQYTWGDWQSDQLRACMAERGQPE